MHIKSRYLSKALSEECSKTHHTFNLNTSNTRVTNICLEQFFIKDCSFYKEKPKENVMCLPLHHATNFLHFCKAQGYMSLKLPNKLSKGCSSSHTVGIPRGCVLKRHHSQIYTKSLYFKIRFKKKSVLCGPQLSSLLGARRGEPQWNLSKAKQRQNKYDSQSNWEREMILRTTDHIY